MNKVILIGNLTKDPDLKFLPGTGGAVSKFTVAVSRGYKEKQETDFLNCVAFGKIAENIATYTTKGSKVCVEGSIRTGNYTDKDGNKRYTTEIYCNNVEFLSKANNTENTQYNKPEPQKNYETSDPFEDAFGIGEDLGVFLEPIDEGDNPF